MQSINPGPVETNMWTVDGEKWIKPNAEMYVESALRSVGMGTHTMGYYSHALLQLVARLGQFFLPYVYEKFVLFNHKRLKPPM